MHQILAYCIQNAFKGLMTIYYLKGEGTGDLVGGSHGSGGGGLSPTECEGNNIEN